MVKRVDMRHQLQLTAHQITTIGKIFMKVCVDGKYMYMRNMVQCNAVSLWNIFTGNHSFTCMYQGLFIGLTLHVHETNPDYSLLRNSCCEMHFTT